MSEPGTPGTPLFDLSDPGYTDSPYDTYRVARDSAPVCPVSPDGPWVVTGRAETTEVLDDPLRFTSRDNTRGGHEFTAACRELLADSVYYRVPPFHADPPGHGRFRALVDEAFTPAALRPREPAVRALAETLVQDMRDAREDGGADLFARFAYPLSLAVIGDLIGVPPADRTTVKAWNDDWLLMQVLPLPEADQLRCAKSVLEFEAYVRALWEERRRHPADDLLSSLAAAGRPADDCVAAVLTLLPSAHETTSHLITNTVHRLLADREQWQAVVADPRLIPAAVEEGLRHSTSLQGVPRTATRDTAVGGVRIPAGAKVQVMVAAPGRDTVAADPDPESFRLDRRGPARHLAFGHGPHTCPGAHLARLQSRIALETLTAVLPGLDLAPGFEPRRIPGGLVLHGLMALPVTWRP
ncbi:cytochrome P450 [Streptomyces sp. NPDC005760]|uniref:cytochrome P450 n=1 Tax=Streptomyces sp. NPDC005760 TaxID=3156718 RepID=UPI0033F18F9B